MRILLLFAVVFVFYAKADVVAQNYDTDSVYYTPIPKPKQKKVENDRDQSLKKIEYFFNLQTGSLIGCNDCGKGKELTFSAATVHGVTIGKKLRAGIGIGLDSYRNWQTLPVFGSVSWDLIGNKNKSAVFLQMVYGWAHPWFVRDGAYSSYTSDPFSSVSGGRMINPQIGYRLKYHSLIISMALGYKFQRIFYGEGEIYPIPNSPMPFCGCLFYNQPTSEITQDMSRVQLVMSVGLK